MGLYSISQTSIAAAAAAAYCTIHTVGTERAFLREVGISLNAATATSIGLGRPANTPTATTSFLGLAHDAAEGASTVNMDTAWSTAPTAPTQFLRRVVFPATAGVGLIWAFPPGQEIIIGLSAWLVLWNFGGAGGSACSVYWTWEE